MNKECHCIELMKFVRSSFLGLDKNFGEASLENCSNCQSLWLLYHYENEAITRSGRWFRGKLSQNQTDGLTANTTLELLGSLEEAYCGGSYFDGKISRWRGQIII